MEEQNHVSNRPLIHVRQTFVFVVTYEEVQCSADFLHGRFALCICFHVFVQHVHQFMRLS